MKRLFAILIGTLAGIILVLILEPMVFPQPPQKYKDFQAEAIKVLEVHTVLDKKCDLLPALETLRRASIHTGYRDYKGEGAATAVPGQGTAPPRIFFDERHEWTLYTGTRAAIHEALHATMKGKRQLCGNDRPNRPHKDYLPSCYLFGKIQRDSREINRDLIEHLPELERLK